MRTIYPVLVVLALGVSGAMIGGSGFADVWGAPTPETDVAQEQVEKNSEKLNPNEKNDKPNQDDKAVVEGPVSSDDSSIVGIVVDSLDSIVDLAAATAVLPVTLQNLGFPMWFAGPIGSVVYIFSGIGVIQFATNRRWI